MTLEEAANDGLDLAGILRAEIRRRFEAGLEKTTVRQLNELVGMQTKLLRAEATMLKEARALEKDLKDKFKSMTMERRRQIVAAMVASLPPEQALLLRADLGWNP